MDKKLKNTLILISFTAVLFAAVLNLDKLSGMLKSAASMLMPVVAGLIIAFVLSVPMNGFEKLITKAAEKRGKTVNSKVINIAGFALTFTLLVLVVGAVFTMVIPQLADSVSVIIDRVQAAFPGWMETLRGYNIDTSWITEKARQLDPEQLLNKLSGEAGDVFSSVVNISSTIASGVMTAAVGLIISIYVLLNRKTLSKQCRKIVYAYCKETIADRICGIASLIRTTYAKFFSGQCVEACILGFLIFLAFSLTGLHYAGLIGILTGFCAFIPYIGAFAACATGAFLMLLTSPAKALLSIAVFLIVQFIEGHFIYPYVVGNSVGLSPLWTLIAALLGAKLFGILGIIFFIPFVAVIFTLLRQSVNSRLVSKNIQL